MYCNDEVIEFESWDEETLTDKSRMRCALRSALTQQI
jgi:hypothetical protein